MDEIEQIACESDVQSAVYRIKVPGGWLYQWVNGTINGPLIDTKFVPDPSTSNPKSTESVDQGGIKPVLSLTCAECNQGHIFVESSIGKDEMWLCACRRLVKVWLNDRTGRSDG